MPGPGGGSSGGGFGGGSFGGGGGNHGGFGGGHFGGGFGHRPYRRGGFFSPFGGYYRPYYGGGCLSGLLGMIAAPIFLLIFAGLFIYSSIGSLTAEIANGGKIQYNEAQFQKYADEQYQKEFGTSTAYEDNLLIVFLTNEEANGYYTIAWIGDNIQTPIINMFGNQNTEFGKAVSANVNQSYFAYSIDSNLAAVMDTMTEKITNLGLESSFKTESDQSKMTQSHMTNYSALSVSANTVNPSLENFTEKTGIPAVIVIDNVENVFEKGFSTGTIITLIIMVALVIFAIWWIIRAVKTRRKYKDVEEIERDEF